MADENITDGIQFLTEPFPVTNRITFTLDVGDDEKHQFKVVKAPIWQEVADAAIEYCKEKGLCFINLSENGTFVFGKQVIGFPDDVKKYIIDQTILKKNELQEPSDTSENN